MTENPSSQIGASRSPLLSKGQPPLMDPLLSQPPPTSPSPPTENSTPRPPLLASPPSTYHPLQNGSQHQQQNRLPPPRSPSASPRRSLISTTSNSPVSSPVISPFIRPQMNSMSPSSVKMPRASLHRVHEGMEGVEGGRTFGRTSRHASDLRADQIPLLAVDKGRSIEDAQKGSAKRLFVWLGAATLVLQTIVFVTLEDVQTSFFSGHRYAFRAHGVFAVSFFFGTAIFACFPSRFLFSLRLLSFLNFLAILIGITFPAVIFVGKDHLWGFVVTLVLVAGVTFNSVLLIPVVFTTASGVPNDCALYAAGGQGLGAVFASLIAMCLVYVLPPPSFILTTTSLAVLVHAIAILSVHRVRCFPWAARRLQRFSDAHSISQRTSVENGRHQSRSPSNLSSHRKSRKCFHAACSSVLKRVFIQLLCAFLATFVSFSLFPAFSIRLGHNVSRVFGVAMVAIFHASDQLGRHVPECGLGLPPFLLLFFTVARVGFLPAYTFMYSATPGSLLSAVWVKLLVQFGLGFTHGWSVASAFRYIPAGFTKYEIERVQFYLSLSNAIGIPCGALLMNTLVWTHKFPVI